MWRLCAKQRADQLEFITRDHPFEVYFTRYSEYDFEQIVKLGRGSGSKSGRISAFADDYNFDPVQENIKAITRDEYPSRAITFVVEGARDGFTVKQYAAVYRCYMDGMSISDPEQASIHFTN